MMLITLVSAGAIHAAKPMQPVGKHDGISIVNNTEGDLSIQWNKGKKTFIKTLKKGNKKFISVPNGTKINVFYSDNIEDHNMKSCKGEGRPLSFTTNNKTVLYTITGGYYDGVGAFNRAAPGHHCIIKYHKEIEN